MRRRSRLAAEPQRSARLHAGEPDPQPHDRPDNCRAGAHQVCRTHRGCASVCAGGRVRAGRACRASGS
eukprot:3091921-Pleurochrysis_carterae.AAC.1